MRGGNLHTRQAQIQTAKKYRMNEEKRQYIGNLLKKREEFERKQREIFNAGQSKHSHAEIGDWLKCFPCMVRRKDQIETRHKMGLVDGGRYMKWRKKNMVDYDRRMYVANELDLRFGAKDFQQIPKGAITR